LANASDYLEDKVINITLRGQAWTTITTVYVALYTANPTDANTGTEVSGGSYVRMASTWNAPSNGLSTNTTDITFPVATAGWGTITHMGILDASSGGNLLYHGAITSPITLLSGQQAKFLAGDLSVTAA
jgi:hypothetical protein